ncbi:metal ABC transporter ATP-binding protein [Motilimonas sp. E26]|uniref:metal ABC transporter ATP-binding protein n=1 Tax=Motilimonas TaxID=1914248 RepID=UPI001E4AD10E|nr:metal ABC transporter ATP-binding protein [Motilimonas sp. E26]
MMNIKITGPQIQLQNVCLSYGEHGAQILGPITHTLAAGQCHVVMGPNGGGKTSLLRSMLGLTPFTGRIHLDWPNGRGRVAYVPQKASFEPSLPLTVMDFMLLNQSQIPLFWRRKAKTIKRIKDQLGVLGMVEKAERKMGRLSGGEQQRVLFAQALLDAPDLIMLDEPANGMDEQGISLIEFLIKELVTKGATVVAVHHDLNAIKRIAHQVHVINKTLLTSGSVDQVLPKAQPTDFVSLCQLSQHQSNHQIRAMA